MGLTGTSLGLRAASPRVSADHTPQSSPEEEHS